MIDIFKYLYFHIDILVNTKNTKQTQNFSLSIFNKEPT